MKKKGKSIVLTSHLLSEIQDNVDKVVILKNGKVFFHGKIEQLKEKLQIAYVYEIRFSRISKDKIEKIEKYCAYYNIPILEKYSNYIMFSLEKEKKTENLQKLFEKLGLEFEVISFRKPNLDEVFLRT
jgi:ABC-type multidrug transport system ATPase subunit